MIGRGPARAKKKPAITIPGASAQSRGTTVASHATESAASAGKCANGSAAKTASASVSSAE